MDVSTAENFIPGESEYDKNPEWELIKTHGQQKPAAMCHHTSVAFKGKMYLFGGSTRDTENLDLFSLDLVKF